MRGLGCSHSGTWGPGYLPGGACPRPHPYLHSPRAPRDSRAGTKSFMSGVLGRLRNEGSATCPRSASLYPVLGGLTRFAPPCGPISAPGLPPPSSRGLLVPRGEELGEGGRWGRRTREQERCPGGLGARGEDTQPTPTSQVPPALPSWGMLFPSHLSAAPREWQSLSFVPSLVSVPSGDRHLEQGS